MIIGGISVFLCVWRAGVNIPPVFVGGIFSDFDQPLVFGGRDAEIFLEHPVERGTFGEFIHVADLLDRKPFLQAFGGGAHADAVDEIIRRGLEIFAEKVEKGTLGDGKQLGEIGNRDLFPRMLVDINQNFCD